MKLLLETRETRYLRLQTPAPKKRMKESDAKGRHLNEFPEYQPILQSIPIFRGSGDTGSNLPRRVLRQAALGNNRKFAVSPVSHIMGAQAQRIRSLISEREEYVYTYSRLASGCRKHLRSDTERHRVLKDRIGQEWSYVRLLCGR